MTDAIITTAQGKSDDEPSGYETSRLNATRHGVLSRFSVLPWENAGEYSALLASLTDEHQPIGTIEGHLVEELAGVIWRKRRLRLAEAAAHRSGLNRALETGTQTAKSAVAHAHAGSDGEEVVRAVQSTDDEAAIDLADLKDDEARTRRALAILTTQRNDAYEASLTELREDTRDWWARELHGQADPEDRAEPYAADAANLRRFIEDEVLPWLEDRKRDIADRPLIRSQALGQSLDPDKLERLGRYEVHLDRKLERTLSTLIRLQELRQERTA